MKNKIILSPGDRGSKSFSYLAVNSVAIGIGKTICDSRLAGRTQVMLERLVEFATQIPDDQTENRKILLVGDPTGLSLSRSIEFVKVIQELQNKNIDIVFHTTQITSEEITSKNLNYPDIVEKYNHSYSGVIEGCIESIEKLRVSLHKLSIMEPQKTVQENYSFNRGKPTPIKGRSSKKGKNNPQSGSNFHK